MLHMWRHVLTHDLCPPMQRFCRQIVQAIGFTYEQHMSTHRGAFFTHEHHILTRCGTRLVYLGLIKYETRRRLWTSSVATLWNMCFHMRKYGSSQILEHAFGTRYVICYRSMEQCSHMKMHALARRGTCFKRTCEEAYVYTLCSHFLMW